MGKNTVQAQQLLEKCYSNSVPLKTTICPWYADFKYGCTDTNDAKCSGRPNEAVTPENIKQVLKFVMDNHKLKVCEITEIVNISVEVHYNFIQRIGMKKVFPSECHICSQWNKNNSELTIQRPVWLCLLTISRISCIGESCLKHPKTRQPAGKFVASVFWNVPCIIYIDFIEKRKSINVDYYVELLACLKDEIKKKNKRMKKKKNQWTVLQFNENDGQI